MHRQFLLFSSLLIFLFTAPSFASQREGDQVCAAAQAAYLKFRGLNSGNNAAYIKALESVDPKLSVSQL